MSLFVYGENVKCLFGYLTLGTCRRLSTVLSHRNTHNTFNIKYKILVPVTADPGNKLTATSRKVNRNNRSLRVTVGAVMLKRIYYSENDL